MRRILTGSFLMAFLFAGQPAKGQKEVALQEWDGERMVELDLRSSIRISGNITDRQLRAQIQQILQTSRPATGDTWAWRDAIEDRLVTLGPQATDFMRSEMNLRDGYEADALQAALFRLENAPLVPREALEHWARRRYPPLRPDAAPVACRIFRVMGIRGMFPHHLFYVIEHPSTRVRHVVALAADGKVQPIDDDAGLTKFLQLEDEPRHSRATRQRLAQAATLLVISRAVSVYNPTAQSADSLAGDDVTAQVQYGGNRAEVTVSFDEAGRVRQVVTTRSPAPAGAPPPPVAPPRTASPPPPIPQ